MRPQILKTWNLSFAKVLFKHYVSPLMLLLLRGKDETPDIEDLGSVLRGTGLD